MSVFNSSVTGGCCFCVSKAHVNKQAELFKTERSVLTHAGSASPAQRQSCWDNLGEGKGTGKREEMMSSVKVQIVQTQIELSWAEHGGGGAFHYSTNENKFRIRLWGTGGGRGALRKAQRTRGGWRTGGGTEEMSVEVNQRGLSTPLSLTPLFAREHGSLMYR